MHNIHSDTKQKPVLNNWYDHAGCAQHVSQFKRSAQQQVTKRVWDIVLLQIWLGGGLVMDWPPCAQWVGHIGSDNYHVIHMTKQVILQHQLNSQRESKK